MGYDKDKHLLWAGGIKMTHELNNNIKLIIWDMDDTFWKGTISEEEVEINSDNVELIKSFVDRGIMNSISSKNDYEVVKNKLSELGIWDLFVFPKINWNPKGAQIKQIIEECRLRPVNVLFIDDNPHNLGEAKQILPEISVAEPSIISELLNSEYLKGNEDKQHKRLKQFKVLEEKQVAQNSCSSNDEFLIKSNIKVDICYDCENEKERILDLINRSNQLNYTKIRLNEHELEELLSNKNYKNCYIRVKDNYGDYGIVGFVSLIKNKAKHFLFSCRTIGMGVEQYVYATLNYPDFEKVGDVISGVKKDYCPNWINKKSNDIKIDKDTFDVSVLLRGGCDLRQMEPYIHFKNFVTEFNYRQYHRDHSVFALDSYYNYQELDEIKEKVPFIWEDNFKTELFSKKYNVIILSVLMDYTQAVYQFKKNKNIKIAFGNYEKPFNFDSFTDGINQDYTWFKENFEFIGRISDEDFIKNLKFIRNHIGNETTLILLNGCEVPYENKNEVDRYKVHIEMNKLVDEFVKDNNNTYLVDVRKFVSERSQLKDNIRHYEREVYYKIAKEISNIISQNYGENIKVTKYNKNKKRISVLLEKIFSIKNSGGCKYLTILGIKIKLKKNKN